MSRAQAEAALLSWAKVAAAAVVAGWMAGVREPSLLLDAALAALLPLIYTALDPNDPRFGRSK